MNHIVEPQSSKSIPHLPLAKPHRSHAKRLAKTKGMSREQWLQVRKQGIGSSDAAAACGLNPHMSMLELWRLKQVGCRTSLINRPKTVIPPYIGATSLNL